MPGEDLCARCYTIEGCCVLDFPDKDQDKAFSHVVPGPLDGPVVGSNRPSRSKDPLGTIVAAARSSRNPSPSYVENPDSEVEVEECLASDDDSDGASAEDHGQEEDGHNPTVLYVCETGTVYTINDDYQPVNAGNYLAAPAETLLLPP